ncbi:NAD(P)H-binding protein [Agrobacterium rhizogenes]|uniref:NmrA family NAD(P)-binding protein n=1 Tax=Rhizobium rhizogenes TaxID=359 RepID=UPI0005616674|nr:NAD(P)H-binding protein [Rhizobium rhizogenes]NTF66466.1 NAD(P)H-binding protein [Rhizobium rhizogenes]NTF79587.1 NAD(P)H-binding protein [Rhizobium rhizogenes]NTH75680.1 NAD(P)H-binding protein [Rhizobium rhizogenes]NTH81686.1 NAD(P)H-binding protein [Rhizobium rhizogenes]
MFAILGATGKIGRTTIAALRERGAPVRAILRDRSRAQEFVDLGCEVAVADMADVGALSDAIDGARAVQVICPIDVRAIDARAEMLRLIETMGEALDKANPELVLAISDYGAEVRSGTGITLLFNALEARLRKLRSRTIFLRSAEHMENWARVTRVAFETGQLHSFHHPLTKLFPTVSAFDVGAIAADLLLEEKDMSLRIVHAEGPRRYTPHDVAAVITSLVARPVVARELPRSQWEAILTRGGLSESYARLVTELYEAHNAGRIDAERDAGEIRRGTSELADALRRFVTP